MNFYISQAVCRGFEPLVLTNSRSQGGCLRPDSTNTPKRYGQDLNLRAPKKGYRSSNPADSANSPTTPNNTKRWDWQDSNLRRTNQWVLNPPHLPLCYNLMWRCGKNHIFLVGIITRGTKQSSKVIGRIWTDITGLRGRCNDQLYYNNSFKWMQPELNGHLWVWSPEG